MEWLAVGIVVVGLMFGFGEAWAETRGPEAREHWLRQLVTEVYPDAVVVLGQPTSIPPHGVTVRTVRRGKVELRVALDQPTRNDDASEPIAGLDPNQALLSSEAKAMCLPAASAGRRRCVHRRVQVSEANARTSLARASPKPQPKRALDLGLEVGPEALVWTTKIRDAGELKTAVAFIVHERDKRLEHRTGKCKI